MVRGARYAVAVQRTESGGVFQSRAHPHHIAAKARVPHALPPLPHFGQGAGNWRGTGEGGTGVGSSSFAGQIVHIVELYSDVGGVLYL